MEAARLREVVRPSDIKKHAMMFGCVIEILPSKTFNLFYLLYNKRTDRIKGTADLLQILGRYLHASAEMQLK